MFGLNFYKWAWRTIWNNG